MSNQFNPGKFQGEPEYVESFWIRGLDGNADDDDGEVFTFIITESDVVDYPQLKVGQRLRLAECDDGFVFSELVDATD